MSAGAGESRSREVYREAESVPAPPPPKPLPAQDEQRHWLWQNLQEAGDAQRAGSTLERFLAAETTAEALQLWLGSWIPEDKRQLALRLNRDVLLIDELINAQLNAILHHPKFQQLESSWRGLKYLVERVDEEEAANVKIRVLNVSRRELERDFERAIEFDQSQLFRKVYEDEFGRPGGEPFGLLIGDFEFHPRVTPEHPHDDMSLLRNLAQVAAAAFCPFVAASAPAMFGLDDFSDLEVTIDHERTFSALEYLNWQNLRRMEEARFVGLTMPRVLMRVPYDVDCSPEYRRDNPNAERFHFREDVSGPDRSKYLWGNASYAFAGVVIRAFVTSGWFADIRGVQRGVDGGGLVTDLPVHSFSTDKNGVAIKSSTDVVITDTLEKQLSELGFMALCDCQDTEYSAFYSAHSIQKPERYDRPEATRNAEISSRLQYMLCVSRFAHYIKVLGRERLGVFQDAQEFQHALHNWLFRYVTSDSEASMETKARHPLREARVQVTDTPGQPGAFQCVMHLSPHFELERMVASVRLATEIAPPRAP